MVPLLDGRRFTLGEIERAFCRVFGVTEERRVRVLRARLRAVQKTGLAVESPGRGRVVRYSTRDACDLALALSLCDFGITPMRAAGLVITGSYQHASLFEDIVDDWPKHVLLILKPAIFADDFFENVSREDLDARKGRTGYLTLAEDFELSEIEAFNTRALIIDLTRLALDVQQALPASTLRGAI